ncbi:MAG: hypothetical protein NZ898_07255 [Myxococcota bacterium]|nr:hypothetical protein [Myxococcota bacterium]MDW8362155.1 hypothetical protein [Myxococcales bacterium]
MTRPGCGLGPNAVLLAVLAAAWVGLRRDDPRAALDSDPIVQQRLADIEDALALDPGNEAAAMTLADRYLEAGRPGLAIAALGASADAVLDSPALAIRLARALERAGDVDRAHEVARRALARCAASLVQEGGSADDTGLRDGWASERPACSAGLYAALDTQLRALSHMLQWGVHDPIHDERARVAYEVARRRARLTSAEPVVL